MTSSNNPPVSLPWDDEVPVGKYREPSLSVIIEAYYVAHFARHTAERHASEYIAAFDAMLAARATGEAA